MASPVPDLGPVELGLRVLGAAVLGGAVGFERQLRHQSAGFRTHILVSLGAALFTLAGAYGVEPFFRPGPGTGVSFDPTRVAAQVVTGIGFLGAGAIIRTGASVRGLTTAAALWVTAAIGLAVGLGYWSGAVAITVTTLVALYALRWLEEGPMRRLSPNEHELVVDALPTLTVADLTETIGRHKGRIQSIHVQAHDGDSRRLVLLVRLPFSAEAAELADSIGALDGVSAVDWRS
jgi:putative Mg2+ transporter-C (MgtC) family protein